MMQKEQLTDLTVTCLGLKEKSKGNTESIKKLQTTVQLRIVNALLMPSVTEHQMINLSSTVSSQVP